MGSSHLFLPSLCLNSPGGCAWVSSSEGGGAQSPLVTRRPPEQQGLWKGQFLWVASWFCLSQTLLLISRYPNW